VKQQATREAAQHISGQVKAVQRAKMPPLSKTALTGEALRLRDDLQDGRAQDRTKKADKIIVPETWVRVPPTAHRSQALTRSGEGPFVLVAMKCLSNAHSGALEAKCSL
jgi:hypothetical protein